jgi:hypothetical protein
MPQRSHKGGQGHTAGIAYNHNIDTEASSYMEALRGSFYGWMLRRAAAHYGLPKGFPDAVKGLALRGGKHKENEAMLAGAVNKISEARRNEQYLLWVKLNKWALISDSLMLMAGMSMILVTGASLLAAAALGLSAGMTGFALFFNHLAMKNINERHESELQDKLTSLVGKIEEDVLRKIRKNPKKYGLVPIDILFPEPVPVK